MKKIIYIVVSITLLLNTVITSFATSNNHEYGNHWVVAYQYFDSSIANEDMLRCVVNWDDYSAIIHSGWTLGYVHLNY